MVPHFVVVCIWSGRVSVQQCQQKHAMLQYAICVLSALLNRVTWRELHLHYLINPLEREKSATSWVRHRQGLRNGEWSGCSRNEMAEYTSCELLRVTCGGQPSVCRLCTVQVLGSEIKNVGRILGMGGPLIRSKGWSPVHAIKAFGGVEVKPHPCITLLD